LKRFTRREFAKTIGAAGAMAGMPPPSHSASSPAASSYCFGIGGSVAAVIFVSASRSDRADSN
jgi:hypothetical protein